MTEPIRIKRTVKEHDRTKAAVAENPDGTRNIVMRGPLAEIVSQALQVYYRKQDDYRELGGSVESVELITPSGHQFTIEREGGVAMHIYAIAVSNVDPTACFDFADLLSGIDQRDSAALLLLETEGKVDGIALEVLIVMARDAGITTYTSPDKLFKELMVSSAVTPEVVPAETDEPVSEDVPVEPDEANPEAESDTPTFTEDDLSTEALDNYRPKSRKRLRGKSTAFVKSGSAIDAAREADKALREIELLAERVKEQDRIYKAWAVEASNRLVNASSDDYAKIAEDIQRNRPQSPSELLADMNLEWPGIGQFKIARTTDKSDGEVVFVQPKVGGDTEGAETEVELPKDESERTFIRSVRDRISKIGQSIAGILTSSTKDEPTLAKNAERIKEREQTKPATAQTRKARVRTHPKTVAASSDSFFTGVAGYLGDMFGFFTTVLTAE